MWNWLVNQGHLYSALVGAVMGVLVTVVLGGAILNPIIRRVQAAYRKHEETQKQIAKHLDTTTPGGLGAVVEKLDELQTTVSQEGLDGKGQE